MAGATTANLVVVPLDGGLLSLARSAGFPSLIVDVVGWFATGSDYSSIPAARLLDTRFGTATVDGQDAGVGALSAGATLDVTISGRAGVPVTGAAAVVLNVTAVGAATAGFVTVWPAGRARPNASNLNVVAGRDVANVVVVPVGAEGRVSVYSSAESLDVLVDVMGWITTPSSLSVSGSHACVRTGDGDVRCWPVIDDVLQPNPTPHLERVDGVSDVKSLAVGLSHVCAVVPDTTVWCWGQNVSGVLGDVTKPSPSRPGPVPTVTGATAVVSGTVHSCALVGGGHVRCWGNSVHGELGDGNSDVYASPPVDVVGLGDAFALTAGHLHTCALHADATVSCWGYNYYGALGDGMTTESPIPVAVNGLSGVTAVTAGYLHTCALRADGTVRCWGSNLNGELGDGTTVTNNPLPVTVVGLDDAVAISAGFQHTCAVRADSSVVCWGRNTDGELGDGTTIDRNTPVIVSVLTGAASVNAGAGSTCALLTDATVRCWGLNTFGQLGDGTTISSPTPVTVTGL